MIGVTQSITNVASRIPVKISFVLAIKVKIK